MKDLVGPADFNLANCGTVIIRKVTDPPGHDDELRLHDERRDALRASTTSPFPLKDGESQHDRDVKPDSGRNVTEDDPGAGYALTSIDCSASDVPSANYSTDTATRAVTFSIAAGETLDCTFTNTLQQGAIKITKTSSKAAATPLVGLTSGSARTTAHTRRKTRVRPPRPEATTSGRRPTQEASVSTTWHSATTTCRRSQRRAAMR